MPWELTWFSLRFPRDLSAPQVEAALAALTGLPHSARIVFELSAGTDGIRHRLGVTPGAATRVLDSALRGSVPSLGLRTAAQGTPGHGSHHLWQLMPNHGVLRAEDLAAVSANLLAALQPLSAGSAVRLRWHARGGRHPRVLPSPEDQRHGRGRAVRAKLALPGMNVYGELLVTASNAAGRRQLERRVSAALWSLSTPYGRLAADSRGVGWLYFALGLRGRFMNIRELAAVIGWPIDSPDLPGLSVGASRRLAPAVEIGRRGRVLGTSDFGTTPTPVALSPHASTRGLYILGATGTGKTSLIRNLIRDDLEAGRGVAVIETNGDLIADVLDAIPAERIQDVVLLDPLDRTFAVGFNPFAEASDPSLIADQIGELFERLWAASWGPRTAQLAHMGLLTLAQRPGSTLLDLPRIFLDAKFRTEVLSELDDPVGLEVDWRWFQALPEREQATVVAPLMNKVRQFTARRSIRAMLGQPTPPLSMARLMAERKVLLVNLPKGLIGRDTASLLGSLVLTSLWQAAAGRAGIDRADRHPFSLYVDEAQDYAAAPVPWSEMFAQGRKYGLAVTFAHQNLSQLPRDLREVILANARSKVSFVLGASDAKTLEPLFAPALTASDLQALDPFHVAALVGLDDGSTARPVTLLAPDPPQLLGSTDTVRQASRRHYAQPIQAVEQRLRGRAVGRAPSADRPIGKRPRGQS